MAAEAVAAAPHAAATFARRSFSAAVCYASRVSPAAAEECAEPLAGCAPGPVRVRPGCYQLKATTAASTAA
jgi:hypothetical protein